MKKFIYFSAIALVFTVTSCEPEEITPTPTQIPPGMSQTELALLGTWEHDSTIQFNPDGSPFTVQPICANASLTFGDQVSGVTSGSSYLMYYQLYYNMACQNMPSGWLFRNDTLYIVNLSHKVLQVDNHRLVLQQGNVNALIYYSR